MKIFLTDQSNNFSKFLKVLKETPVMRYDKNELIEKKSMIHIVTDKTIQNTDLDFFFAYNIFPEKIMSFLTQWNAEKRAIQVGDTIVQEVYIPPAMIFSQKIIFGVRINEIIDTPERKGFSYETLDGHVERGLSSFFIDNTPSGLLFTIQTFSEPSNVLAKFFAPVFSLPYQAYCTRKALENVKRQLENDRH